MNRTATRSRAFGFLGLAVFCALSLAVRCGEPAEHAELWPEGALLLAERASLSRLLERLDELDGTPLARWSGSIGASLPDCAVVEGRATSGRAADLWRSLRCIDAHAGPIPFHRWKREHDIAFAVPVSGSQLGGFIDVADDGVVEFELFVPRNAVNGALELALPGTKSPGEPILSGSETLIHARVRPAGGLDLASLIPDESQGAHMFRLKSELFAGAVLDGVWELAVYLPEEGTTMPRIAIALGFELRRAAVAAMEDFVRELERTWPVRRSDFRVGDAKGACLLDLKLMPDLAPCFVATDSELIVGWNPASVRKATDGGSGPFRALAELSGNGGVMIDLQRFASADQILSRALATRSGKLSRGYPWSRIVASGAASDRGYRIRVRLLSAVRAASGTGT